MKQKKIGTTLYVFDTTAYEITEDTDAAVIKIQQECIPAYAKLNASLVSKFSPINYKLFCVQNPEWADYMDDYAVSISVTGNGTVTASPNSGDEGEEITLTVTPDSGCELASLGAASGGTAITITDNKFTMPAGNVTVTAIFQGQEFNITCNEDTHGTVSAPATARFGDTVTITTTPAAQYELDTLTVMNGDVPVTVTNNQFTMPPADVTITATFIQVLFDITNFSDADGNTVHAELYGQPGVTVTEARAGSDIVLVDNGVHIDAYDVDFILKSMSIAYGGSTHDLSEYKFTMPSAAVTINATFGALDGGSFDKAYFTIESREDGNSITINPGSSVTYEISTDGSHWDQHTGSYTVDHLDMFDNIMVRSTNDVFINKTGSGSSVTYTSVFSATKDIKTYGNIMSLIYGDSFLDDTTHEPITEFKNNTTDVFRGLFNGCGELRNAKGLVLPATTLVNSCYREMFKQCTTLNYAPKLPATTLTQYCYSGMFNHNELISPPELPATTLAPYCYYYMFAGCSNITTAPDLNATTAASHCYDSMFAECTSLNHIQCLLANAYTFTGWVYHVANSGTFVKNSSATWAEGTNAIPTGWTVTDYVEPTP